MHALVNSGADVIELGVPFSDPMADGPVIQRATEKAIQHGTGLRQVLAMVAEFRQRDKDTPVVLMGYLNPIEAMGGEAFAAAAKDSGVDGVLLVDLPPEEASDYDELLRGAGLDCIMLVAPTTSGVRRQRIIDAARGFIYYVSLKGITGSDALDTDSISATVAELKALAGGIPVGVGFGIKTPERAAAVASFADAVIIGSALVERLDATTSLAEAEAVISAFFTPIRKAMDEASKAAA
jgi:tryptophan synthase alpha chain